MVLIFKEDEMDPRTADLVQILKGGGRDQRTADTIGIFKGGEGSTDRRFGPNFYGNEGVHGRPNRSNF